MKIINYFGDEQKIHYAKMDNGLDVYVATNPKSLGYHVELVVKYGSEIEDFVPVGEKNNYHLPLGVAHFLEHKMFDMESSNAFNFFGKTGTYANAGTSYYYTKYYIDGKKSFEKNLDYFISMIYTPFFEQESIDKEKSIINEEIKMYDDEPEWIIDHVFRNSFFQKIMRDKIAGTVESIKDIDKELLTKVYNTFYQPSNMFLVVTGNVKIENVLQVLENNKALNSRISKQKIVYCEKEEEKIVQDEYQRLTGKIIIPKLKYGYKFSLKDFKLKDTMKLRCYLDAVFSILFNDASEFNEEVFEKKLSTSFYTYFTIIDDLYMVSVDAESEYADMFVEEFDKKLKNIRICEEDFERIKKVWYSVIIRSLDNNYAMANSIVDDLLKDKEVCDNLEFINSLNYQELQEVIKEIDFSNRTLVLMLPEGESK